MASFRYENDINYAFNMSRISFKVLDTLFDIRDGSLSTKNVTVFIDLNTILQVMERDQFTPAFSECTQADDIYLLGVEIFNTVAHYCQYFRKRTRRQVQVYLVRGASAEYTSKRYSKMLDVLPRDCEDLQRLIDHSMTEHIPTLLSMTQYAGLIDMGKIPSFHAPRLLESKDELIEDSMRVHISGDPAWLQYPASSDKDFVIHPKGSHSTIVGHSSILKHVISDYKTAKVESVSPTYMLNYLAFTGGKVFDLFNPKLKGVKLINLIASVLNDVGEFDDGIIKNVFEGSVEEYKMRCRFFNLNDTISKDLLPEDEERILSGLIRKNVHDVDFLFDANDELFQGRLNLNFLQ